METANGVISVDIGTQETSVALITVIDDKAKLVAAGVVGNSMVPGLEPGFKEQRPDDWVEAVRKGMAKLRGKLDELGKEIGQVFCVIVNGQMHGEVIIKEDGSCVPTARLWCDSRNDAEGKELTALFGVKVPTRMTVARWLWTIRNRPEVAEDCVALTTPSGYVTFRLTGQHRLGIGEASGMFPMDISTRNYNTEMLRKFDALVAEAGLAGLRSLLPDPYIAGEFIGTLSAEGAEILGLPEGTPVAPPEGDQPAVLAATYISRPGQCGGSWGTSICANWISDRPFQGVHPAIDHFCDAVGKPINMAWLKNGTTFANAVITFLQRVRGDANNDATYDFVMPLAMAAPADCGGLRALPLMQTEPATEFVEQAFSLLAAINWEKVDGEIVANLLPGNLYKVAFLSSVFNARIGLDELRRQGCPANELILTGGVLKTDISTRFAAQLIASALNIPVRVLPGGEEGTAFGGGLLGLYAHRRQTEPQLGYEQFLDEMLGAEKGDVFQPDAADVAAYNGMYRQHLELLRRAEPALIASLGKA